MILEGLALRGVIFEEDCAQADWMRRGDLIEQGVIFNDQECHVGVIDDPAQPLRGVVRFKSDHRAASVQRGMMGNLPFQADGRQNAHVHAGGQAPSYEG
jgi:hypothetical protein